MIIDLFVPYQENDEQPLDVGLLCETIRNAGIDAVCLVSENAPPAEDSKAVQECGVGLRVCSDLLALYFVRGFDFGRQCDDYRPTFWSRVSSSAGWCSSFCFLI